jgi:hypothetical protein
MTTMNLTVSSITPNLPILGDYQEFIFNENVPNAAFRLHNVVTPTNLIPTSTLFEIRNNLLSGYRLGHFSTLDDNNDTPGTLKLQSFQNIDNSITDLISFLPDGSISIFAPISFDVDLDMGSHNIINLADPINSQDAATKSWVLSQIGGDTDPITLVGGVTGSGVTGSPITTTVVACPVTAIIGYPADSSLFLRGDGTWTNTFPAGLVISGNVLNMSSQKIVGLATPTLVDDAATKSYVDSAISGVPGAITLTGNVTGTGTTGSPISTTVAACAPSALTGYPSNTSSFLRGDGSWSNTLTNGLSISGNTLNMNSQKIVSLATPTTSGDAVNKSYADGIPGSFNVTLTGAVTGSGAANSSISTVFATTTTMQGATQTFDFGASNQSTAFYLKNTCATLPYDNRIGVRKGSTLGPGFAWSHTMSSSSAAPGEFHLVPLGASSDDPYIINVIYDSVVNNNFNVEFNSNVKIGTNTSTSYPYSRLLVNSTLEINTSFQGTQTKTFSQAVGSFSGTTQVCQDVIPVLSPAAQVTGYVAGADIIPTIIVPNVTDPAIANAFGQYINLKIQGTAGKTLTNAAGIFVDIGSLSTTSVTNAYGGYFKNPGFGTNKFALYADNLSIGSASTVPASSGLYVHGQSSFNDTVFMKDKLFSLRSSADLNNGIIYNSTISGTEFRGFTGYSWKIGTAGATEVMSLDNAGILTITGNGAVSSVNGALKLKRSDTSAFGQVMFYTSSTNYMSLGFRSGGTNNLFIYDEINTLNVASFAPGSTPISTFIGNVALGNTGSFGSGLKVVFIANASTVPSTTPVGGGVIYVDPVSGALKYKGSAGTLTQLAPA